MRSSSRPISVDARCSERYAATDNSRPLSVASPHPTTPSAVTTLRVTKLRPGLLTLTSMLWMVMKLLRRGGSCLDSVPSHGGEWVGEVASGPVLGPDGDDQRRERVQDEHHHDRDRAARGGGNPRGNEDGTDAGGDDRGD